jgi:hypothetical protein
MLWPSWVYVGATSVEFGDWKVNLTLNLFWLLFWKHFGASQKQNRKTATLQGRCVKKRSFVKVTFGINFRCILAPKGVPEPFSRALLDPPQDAMKFQTSLNIVSCLLGSGTPLGAKMHRKLMPKVTLTKLLFFTHLPCNVAVFLFCF